MAAPEGLHWWERPGRSFDDPLVILVHGVIDSSARFRAMTELVPDVRFVAFDRRGYGKSEIATEGPRTLAEHAHDLLALADTIGVYEKNRAILVGHSMGGNVTFAAAHAKPEWFSAVAGYEVHAPWLDCWSEETQAGVRAIGADPDPLAMGEATYRRVFGDAWWDSQSADEQHRRRVEGLAYASDMATGHATDFAFEPGSGMSMVVGCGARSQALFVHATKRLAEILPAVYVELPGAKHAAHITHPAEFAEFVRATVRAGLNSRRAD